MVKQHYKEYIMINYHNLKFSAHYSNQRINLLNKIIGEKTVKNIIALALYLWLFRDCCGRFRK